MHGFKQIKCDTFLSLKEIVILRAGKYPCGKPFFNDNGPAAILGLINFSVAFTLLFYQCAESRRPVKDCSVRKMENIVKPVSIRIKNVIG